MKVALRVDRDISTSNIIDEPEYTDNPSVHYTDPAHCLKRDTDIQFLEKVTLFGIGKCVMINDLSKNLEHFTEVIPLVFDAFLMRSCWSF